MTRVIEVDRSALDRVRVQEDPPLEPVVEQALVQVGHATARSARWGNPSGD